MSRWRRCAKLFVFFVVLVAMDLFSTLGWGQASRSDFAIGHSR